MAIAGQYDFVPLIGREWSNTVSLGIFQWIYKADGHGLKKSKAIYRVKGLAHEWKAINKRAEVLCESMNKHDPKMETFYGKKSETI